MTKTSYPAEPVLGCDRKSVDDSHGASRTVRLSQARGLYDQGAKRSALTALPRRVHHSGPCNGKAAQRFHVGVVCLSGMVTSHSPASQRRYLRRGWSFGLGFWAVATGGYFEKRHHSQCGCRNATMAGVRPTYALARLKLARPRLLGHDRRVVADVSRWDGRSGQGRDVVPYVNHPQYGAPRTWY